MDDLLKLLGLGTPFAYAAATYKFFDVADQRISREAKAIISGWIQSFRYDTAYIAWAFRTLRSGLRVSLLSWRTLVGWPPIVQAVLIFELDKEIVGLSAKYRVVGAMWILQILVNIACDYFSIFAISLWLGIAGRRPIFALFGGLFVGVAVIKLLYVLLGLAYTTDFNIQPHGNKELEDILQNRVPSVVVTLAAFAIHLWLPLLAVSLMVARFLSWFARATKWTQWFVEGGKDHPVQSVGYVASAIVFCMSIAVHWLPYLKRLL